jgi:hypothetical protein
MKITIIILNLLIFCGVFFLLVFVKKREKITQIVTFESESKDNIFDSDFDNRSKARNSD